MSESEIDETARRVGFEAMKLLLQVAWADHGIAIEEARTVLTLAKDRCLSDDQMDELAACLAGKRRLPPPDMGLLRWHRDEVLALVMQLLAADRSIAEEEEAIVDEIRALLGS
jgi:uncharacterized tellurite resistance protein B-like protein